MSEVDFSEVYKLFNNLEKNYEKVENKAVSKGAEVVAEKLKENTPSWDYGGKRIYSTYWNNKLSKRIARDKPDHAKNDIKVSKAKEGYSEVGFGNDSYWYMHFIEFGTFKIKPQSFASRTQKESEKEVIETMAEVIKKELLKK